MLLLGALPQGWGYAAGHPATTSAFYESQVAAEVAQLCSSTVKHQQATASIRMED